MPIDRNTAQYITGNPQQPTQSSAPGIWDIDEQGSAQAAGRWPLPPNVVQRSLRFNSADSAYLNRTPAAGNRKTWTWSCWFKLGITGDANFRAFLEAFTGGNSVYCAIAYSNGAIYLTQDNGSGGVMTVYTSPVYRDPSSWYHLVLGVDTTNSTPANTVRIYINGAQQSVAGSYPATNLDTWVNSANPHRIGARWSGPNSSSNFDGYMAEVNFIDGYPTGYNQTTFASLNVATLFGQTDAQTGQWIPRVYSGSYGTNGYRLQFLDNSGTTATTLGKDTSGLGNNWTPNNFSVAAGSGNDSLRDVPMNYYSPDNGLGGEVIGNYATFNPLSNPGNSTLTNGNLDVSTPNATAGRVLSTLGPSSGRWYCEFTVTNVGAGFRTGIVLNGFNDGDIIGKYANEYAYASDGNKYSNSVSASYGATYTTGDIIGVALDLESATTSLTFYKNGVSQGVAYTGMSGIFMFGVCDITGASGISSTANFGQRPFAYTAPSGFKALCTQNLSAPRIGNVAVSQANDYFNTVIWSGNGSTQSPTTDFAPDLVWVKNRSSNWSNLLYDTLRGPSTGSTSKALSSNGTDAEGVINDNSTYGYLSAFNSNGFTLTAGSYVGAGGYTNTSGQNYVGWCWNAGGSTVTNTSGSITSSVRANQTSGFSVVRFTGSATNNTVGHGLGAAPSFIIVKAASESGQSWRCYHQSLGLNSFITLNTTAGAESLAAYWGSSAFTTDIFGVYAGGGAGNNRTGQTMIAYCFAAVPGFSAFGSYTGNGSPDGPFVYTGFRPAFILGKRTDVSSIQGWFLFDAVRNTFNQVDLYLSPSSSNSQGTFAFGDMLSNGFKLRSTTVDWNSSGIPYIYAAFAEIPFQFANAR